MTDAKKALAMIQRAAKQGRASDISITRDGTPGEYDPSTNTWIPGSDPVVLAGLGVKTNYLQADIDGTVIQQGDIKLLVPAADFDRPVTGDALTVGDQVYAVIAVGIVAPGDDDVLYVLQLRGAA